MIRVFNNKIQLGQAAARQAADAIERAISEHGRARIIAATGMSQFEFLNALTETPGVDWTKVEMFHLDEYVGLPATHPASFRKYLLERLIEPAGITRYHLLDGEADPGEVCRRVGEEITAAPIASESVTGMSLTICGHTGVWLRNEYPKQGGGQ